MNVGDSRVRRGRLERRSARSMCATPSRSSAPSRPSRALRMAVWSQHRAPRRRLPSPGPAGAQWEMSSPHAVLDNGGPLPS